MGLGEIKWILLLEIAQRNANKTSLDTPKTLQTHGYFSEKCTPQDEQNEIK